MKKKGKGLIQCSPHLAAPKNKVQPSPACPMTQTDTTSTALAMNNRLVALINSTPHTQPAMATDSRTTSSMNTAMSLQQGHG